MLWVNYYPAYLAYKIIKYFVLDHPEYSHVALLADDLIVEQEDIDQIWKDVNLGEMGEIFDMQKVVISGCCNVDLTTWKNYLNVSVDLPSRSSYGRKYNFLRKDDTSFSGLEQMGFCGTALMIIPGDIVPRLSFENDYRYSGLPEDMGCCQDVMLCNDLHDLGVPMYVDFRVNMLHLKMYDGIWFPLATGIKEPHCKLQVSKQRNEML